MLCYKTTPADVYTSGSSYLFILNRRKFNEKCVYTYMYICITNRRVIDTFRLFQYHAKEVVTMVACVLDYMVVNVRLDLEGNTVREVRNMLLSLAHACRPNGFCVRYFGVYLHLN